METGQYLTMNGFAQCPAGLPVDQSKATCNTGLYIESWNTHHVVEPLRYERNEQVRWGYFILFYFIQL